MLEFRSTKPPATSQPYRLEPELRSLNVSLHVDVRCFVAICRVEEKPVRALAMDRWHEISVSLCASRVGRRTGESFSMPMHARLATVSFDPRPHWAAGAHGIGRLLMPNSVAMNSLTALPPLISNTGGALACQLARRQS
jgi:hypothetical protein